MSHGQLAAEALGAACGLVASPYVARLSLSVPDRENARWWAGVPASGRRVGAALVVGVVLGLLAGHGVGWSALLPLWLVLTVLCAPLVMIDFEHHRLPDRLVVGCAVSTVVLLIVASAVRSDWHALLRSVEAGAVVFAIFFLLALFAPFGFGDVKLGGVLAAALGWLSWGYVIYGLLAGFVLASVASLPLVALRKASMKSAIPLGPALIAGAFLVVGFHLVPSYLR
jgi:leader peptidase (prepilin peptidase) / N-methyltransferase